jgi:hypothetical protein
MFSKFGVLFDPRSSFAFCAGKIFSDGHPGTKVADKALAYFCGIVLSWTCRYWQDTHIGLRETMRCRDRQLVLKIYYSHRG